MPVKKAKPRRAKPRPSATPARTAAILDILEATHPEARCALNYESPFQLVAATILSAQCTDERVNLVTRGLFRLYPTASALAVAAPAQVEELVRSTGFFRAKTKSLIGCARALVASHGGEVPRRMEDLVKLPGVGRKTASVVLGHAFELAEGIAVDTHVLRVSNRLGLVHDDDPAKVEAKLMRLIPRERWIRTTDLLIFHGRKICDARAPACGRCPLFSRCAWESRQAHAGDPPRRRRS